MNISGFGYGDVCPVSGVGSELPSDGACGGLLVMGSILTWAGGLRLRGCGAWRQLIPMVVAGLFATSLDMCYAGCAPSAYSPNLGKDDHTTLDWVVNGIMVNDGRYLSGVQLKAAIESQCGVEVTNIPHIQVPRLRGPGLLLASSPLWVFLLTFTGWLLMDWLLNLRLVTLVNWVTGSTSLPKSLSLLASSLVL